MKNWNLYLKDSDRMEMGNRFVARCGPYLDPARYPAGVTADRFDPVGLLASMRDQVAAEVALLEAAGRHATRAQNRADQARIERDRYARIGLNVIAATRARVRAELLLDQGCDAGQRQALIDDLFSDGAPSRLRYRLSDLSAVLGGVIARLMNYPRLAASVNIGQLELWLTGLRQAEEGCNVALAEAEDGRQQLLAERDRFAAVWGAAKYLVGMIGSLFGLPESAQAMLFADRDHQWLAARTSKEQAEAEGAESGNGEIDEEGTDADSGDEVEEEIEEVEFDIAEEGIATGGNGNGAGAEAAPPLAAAPAGL